jgi:hypothetical protein
MECEGLIEKEAIVNKVSARVKLLGRSDPFIVTSTSSLFFSR